MSKTTHEVHTTLPKIKYHDHCVKKAEQQIKGVYKNPLSVSLSLFNHTFVPHFC